MLNKEVVLNNGYKIPSVGFGTWLMDDDTSSSVVQTAIKSGYTHIDTAAFYGNEEGIGRGIKESGISRDKLFITSKVWVNNREYDKAIASFDNTLKKLQLDYLDLFMIHWPANKIYSEQWVDVNNETWRALEDIYKSGKAKAIGVCNFTVPYLKPLLEGASIKPMVDQIECHPGFYQKGTADFCKANDIAVEAWSPLGRSQVLNNEKLLKIADKYNKSVAQLCIRWNMQHDIIPLPKSSTPSRIVDNLKVFDFEIDAEDMKLIDELEYCGGPKLDPDTFDKK